MSPDPGAPMRFLALGDSYTIGEGVAAAERWPNQLAAALRDRGIAIADPLIVATTGWTTDELGAAIVATELAPPYGLVSLLIGVNNQYRGRSLDNYRDEFGALLEQAVDFADDDVKRVIVVSIPDWGVTGFAAAGDRDLTTIAREIDAFNTIGRDLAERRGTCFVDITGLTRRHPEEVVDDGLHPSAAQYGRWIERILPQAVAILAGPR